MKVYKVVRCDDATMKSFSFVGPLELKYEVGKPTEPWLGKIFCFTERQHAEDFRRFVGGDQILYGEAEGVTPIFLSLWDPIQPISEADDEVEGAAGFIQWFKEWWKKAEEGAEGDWCRVAELASVPRGSHVCSKFTPEMVL